MLKGLSRPPQVEDGALNNWLQHMYRIMLERVVDTDDAMAATTEHGDLDGLGDDDHHQYVLEDGTRAMSGDLDMGTNDITNVGTVDGVDVSTLTSDHTGLTNIGTNTHAQIDTHIADSTIHFTEGSIDHGSIAGLSDDDHTQYLLADGTRECTGQMLFTTGLKVQESGAGTDEVTIVGNSLMAAGFTITLPSALPGSTLPMLISAAGAVTTAALGSSQLGTDSVTATQIATGAVDTDELAADAVTGDKIADDQIDSEHYVTGSIDAEHCNFMYPLMHAVNVTTTAAGSTTTFHGDSRTNAFFREYVPSGTTWYILGITAIVDTGGSAGDYTINVGIAEYDDHDSSSVASTTQLLEITSSTANSHEEASDMSGTIASPLMTITGASGKGVRFYIENEGTSPGSIGAQHTVAIYGFIA